MADVEKLAHALARGSTYERVLRVVPIVAPAAGAELSLTVPGGSVWIPRALKATLVTSAAVATRSVNLQLSDGSTSLWHLFAGATQVAGLTVVYSFVAGWDLATGTSGQGDVSCGLPDMALPAGYVLSTHTNLLDVADQWSAGVVWVEEVLAQPQGVHEMINAGIEGRLIGTSLAAEAQQ
jgi:hypothetical protein